MNALSVGSKDLRRFAGAAAAALLLIGNRVIDDPIRHFLAPNEVVGGPVWLGFNLDATAGAFLVLMSIVWVLAELMLKRLRLPYVGAALLALGAFYSGCALAIVGGARSHYWLQQTAEQENYFHIGSALFAALFFWRFRPSGGQVFAAAAIWLFWFFWLGEAATHDGQSYGGMYR